MNFILSNSRALKVLEAAEVIKRTCVQIEEFQVHIDTAARDKFTFIKDQQSQYRHHNQEILLLSARIQQLQHDLKEIEDGLPPRIDTLDVTALSNAPGELHGHLSLIRETLLELPLEGQNQ